MEIYKQNNNLNKICNILLFNMDNTQFEQDYTSFSIESNLDKKQIAEEYSYKKSPIPTANEITNTKIKELYAKINFVLKTNQPYCYVINPKNHSLPKINDNLEQINSHSNVTKDPSKEIYRYYKQNKLKMVYRRFNNKKYYQISKHSKIYLSSIFINPATIKKTFTKPLYQELECDQEVFQNDCSLEFDSRFQSGNLYAVFQKGPKQFDLILQNDINTKGYALWFYFQVRSKSSGIYNFNIINISKGKNLYKLGLKPLIRKENQTKWIPLASKVQFKQHIAKGQEDSSLLNSLTFNLNLTESKTVSIAYSYPYTYTMLINYILSLKIKKSPDLKIFNMCSSLAGNSIPYLCISESINSVQKNNNIQRRQQTIYIFARQHPGQSPSSYVIQGIINELLHDDKISIYLRKNYVFKIFPMINVDGVINGSYRTNLSGFDLNRKWDFPSEELHPQIHFLKQMIVTEKNNIKMILDLHAHSQKLKTFFYGLPSHFFQCKSKLFPYICSIDNQDIVFQNCRFEISQDKKTTARAILAGFLENKNFYTYEVSFYGRHNYQYSQSDYRSMGVNLLRSLYKYSFQDRLEIMKQIQNKNQKEIFSFLRKCVDKLKNTNYKNDEDSGSDSEPELYQLNLKELRLLHMKSCAKMWRLSIKNQTFLENELIISNSSKISPKKDISNKQLSNLKLPNKSFNINSFNKRIKSQLPEINKDFTQELLQSELVADQEPKLNMRQASENITKKIEMTNKSFLIGQTMFHQQLQWLHSPKNNKFQYLNFIKRPKKLSPNILNQSTEFRERLRSKLKIKNYNDDESKPRIKRIIRSQIVTQLDNKSEI